MASKGVIIEFDFTVLKGADILFQIVRDYLKELDNIELDDALEARYLVGKTYVDGLTAMFATIKTKKTAQKAAREIESAFIAALGEAASSAITLGFENFVNTIADKSVKVIISTRIPIEDAQLIFKDILNENVLLYQDKQHVYGAYQWDSWRRAAAEFSLIRPGSLTIAGSGLSTNSSLIAGIGCAAIMNPRVQYQDFTGASVFLKDFSTTSARKVLELIHVQ